MRYTNVIEIARPRDHVARLLADPAHLPSWLRGMVVHEPVDGAHGALGTTSRVVMRSGRSTTEMTETVTRREPDDLDDVPADVVVHFARETLGPGMRMVVSDRLTVAGPATTRWESDSELELTHLLPRLLARVAPRMFHRQSQQHMADFRAFAEHGTDVRGDTA